MWPRGNHSPAGQSSFRVLTPAERSKKQSRFRVFNPAERMDIGSEFSPLVDAFHLSFPASVEQYISNPTYVSGEAGTSGCLDHCPCHGNCFGHNDNPRPVNGVSVDRDSTHSTSHRTSVAHCDDADNRGDNLAIGAGPPIFKLPSEVSDLILSYLSPAALDAARHTSKEWRTRILSSPWVLSSVLGVSRKYLPLSASTKEETSHRNLLKKLDRESDLPSTFQHPDGWRTRFRTRHVDFSIPSASSPLTRSVLVAATRIDTQNGLLVLQLKNYPQDAAHRSQSTLLFYRFDSTELPCYAGALHDVQGQGALRIIDMIEIKPLTAWALHLKIGDTLGLYLLTAREAFSDTGSHFSIRRLESSENLPGLLEKRFIIRESDSLTKPLPNSDPSWEILARFPQFEIPRHARLPEDLCRYPGSRFLAGQTATRNIYLVRDAGPPRKPPPNASFPPSKSLSNDTGNGNRYFIGVALLSRPRSDSVYQNVAVAPTVVRDGSTRVAIIWRTADSEKSISELYVYDVPNPVYYETYRARSNDKLDNVSTMAEDLGEGATLRKCYLVQGKRVTSLGRRIGGIHPSSSLYQRALPQDIALGGIDFPHTFENQEAYPRNVQYQKCFVWGPASSEIECTQLSMKIFDFSYADPQRMQSVFRFGMGTVWGCDKRFHNIALDAIHCACALHDDGIRVVLPDVTTTIEASDPPAVERSRNPTEIVASSSPVAQSAPLMESLSSLYRSPARSVWPSWRPLTSSYRKNKTPPNETVGSVSCNDPPARRAALERRQEWLRGRILGMKRVGLTEFEIAELWFVALWTRDGLVRKPEGWRELGGAEST